MAINPSVSKICCFYPSTVKIIFPHFFLIEILKKIALYSYCSNASLSTVRMIKQFCGILNSQQGPVSFFTAV